MKVVLKALVALCLAALFTAPAIGSIWLADYHGYDFTWPLPQNYTDEGQFYATIGPMVSANADFMVMDEDNYEYTVHIHSGALSTTETVGTYVFYNYYGGDGTISFYEDSRIDGTSADYGTYPPNPTAPSTFIDGTHLLGGYFTSLTIVIETVSGNGSFTGTINFNEGVCIENMSSTIRAGWTLAALGLGQPPYTPSGYTNQVDGEVYLDQLPTATHSATWGQIKSFYND
ncbi:MAG: hypothetical protein KJ970_11760 [Candidatus Eisenbacteria bacterium]|uniref:PEP-CTERM sorting domain-containing protein n=1 Tax=Eiseniibacteriota bacterium TaxID=2212470 RepID=A0A948S0I7_UNCEI|nr:hypothetical protein [Candidatus Eisenbacteria bacterium]MBU1950794.1 hypothetical protein [Candidatus Eisenbacteria bacterium]MBU2691594.1 hypothetical protein [Candidatus Eisenbacteria bacterium]